MTDDSVRAWLAVRGPAAPPGLAARLEDATGIDGAAGNQGLADHLARLGLALLNRVAGAPAGGRELAADLLAADAMVTYAFEAQADADVSGLEGLADWVARQERGGAGDA